MPTEAVCMKSSYQRVPHTEESDVSHGMHARAGGQTLCIAHVLIQKDCNSSKAFWSVINPHFGRVESN